MLKDYDQRISTSVNRSGAADSGGYGFLTGMVFGSLMMGAAWIAVEDDPKLLQLLQAALPIGVQAAENVSVDSSLGQEGSSKSKDDGSSRAAMGLRLGELLPEVTDYLAKGRRDSSTP